MKHILRHFVIIALLLLSAATLMAQSPKKFNYQAVVRNASNVLVRNSQVGVRISISRDESNSDIVFQETHTPTTNANGLLSVQVGTGSLVYGSIAGIDWADGPYFLTSDIDINGGTNYTISVSQQLLSVPYALHCDEVQNLGDVVAKNNHAGMKQLKDVKDPTDPQDAVTKYYLDSIINALTVVIYSPTRSEVDTACDRYTWAVDGETYTNSGTYIYTKTNACGSGCDSIITLRLTILKTDPVILTKLVCGTSPYTWAAAGEEGTKGTGSDYTVAGTYPGTSYNQTISGKTCATADTLHLSFGTNSTGTHTATACDNYFWIDNTTNYTESNTTATATLENSQGCDSVVTLNLTINKNAGVEENVSICAGSSYEWFGNTIAATGVSRHSYLDANGCTGDSTLFLTVVDAPAVTLGDFIGGSDINLCAGQTTTLTAPVSSSNGTITYAWTRNDVVVPAATSSALEINSDGTYKVTVTASNTSCADVATDEASITVTAIPAPEISVSASADPTTICAGNSTTLTATPAYSGSGTPTYSWSPSSQTGASVSVSPATTTTYTVTASVTENGCTTTATDEVEVHVTSPSLTATTSQTATSVVLNSSATLTVTPTVSPTGGTFNYSWSASPSSGAGLPVTTSGSSLNSIDVTPTAAGTYTYTATIQYTTPDGCPTQITKTFELTANACNITSSVAFQSYSYSGGTSTNIPIQVGATLNGATNGGYTFEIVSATAAGAEIRAGSYSYQKNVYATGAGTVTVRCTMHVTKDGCEKDVTDETTVTINACSVKINSVSVSRYGTACNTIPFALQATVSVTPSNATLTYQWNRQSPTSSYWYSIGSYAKSGGTSKSVYIIETASSGTDVFKYQVVVTATKDGCVDTKTSETQYVTVGKNQSTGITNTSSTTASRSGTILTFKAKSAHSYVIWSVVPSDAENSDPSGLMWKTFSASTSSQGSGTAVVPASGGTVYYYDSKSNSTSTCPQSSGSYQGTSIKEKTY